MGFLEFCSKLLRNLMGLLMSWFFNSPSHHGGENGDQTLKASTSSTLHPPPLGKGSSSTSPPFEASSSSTLPSSLEQQYEVFLSFRGETRRGFTDHLYKRLDNAKVLVFRDKEGLPMGKRNWPEIVKAIETSRISILVISPEYASSEWCLNELVQILKCKETFGQLVIPIFYRVTPSDVRKKSDVLEREFQLRKKRRQDFDGTHVQQWKDALMEVSYMTGLELEKIADGYEGEFVEIIVTKVLKALRKPTLVLSDDLVGVGGHIEKIMKMINVEGSDYVHALLIHGMGGIGKTTLAKVIYNQLTHHFDCYSFLANIRETWSQYKGKVDLQEQLIHDIIGQKQSISSVDEGVKIIRDRFKNKKVLILFDDVDHSDQLNALAGKWDWFGRGSMLIVTSRMKNILKEWEGSFCYELNGLDEEQSFILFCKHAFKKSHSIPNEFHMIAKEIVSTTGGLPLAIEVIGCLLYNENQDIWNEKLKKLKEIPDDEVQNKLKISFDALKPEEQEIFLDIACLPIHKERELALHMWNSCDFFPELGIRRLILMSLIKIGEKEELLIHDQLRDLGREIVRQRSISNLGKRSRLWKEDEAREVLELRKGTQEIQTLNLSLDYSERDGYIRSEQFEGMTELRYLQMDGVDVRGDCKNLFQNLRWLKWKRGELDFMQSFIPKKLVVLQLASFNIAEGWVGWNQIKHLKILKLKHCRYLTAIPDFSALKELEVLILHWCSNLIEIHPSIGKLKKTLKVLHVRGCEKLESPIQVGKMEELKELILDGNKLIREIPISEGYMAKLETLSITYSKKVKCIPDSVGSLVKLQRLNLRGCKLLTEIPKSIGNLKLLIEIDLTRTGVTQLPDSIGDLCNLESLRLSTTPMRCLPTSIQMLSKLQVLDLLFCYRLESLPSLPCSLTSLAFHGNLMETLPDFSNLTNLELLQFEDNFMGWNRTLDFRNLNRMRNLEFENSMVKFGHSDSTVFQDREPYTGVLCVWSESQVPKNINLLLELPSNLVKLRLYNCFTLRTLPNFSNLKNLSLLSIWNCPTLMNIDGLDGAESLTHLDIGDCGKLAKLNLMGISATNIMLKKLDALESLPHLSTAKNLKDLKIEGCGNLVEIKVLDDAEGIQKVLISECPSLEKIGDLSHLKMLTTLELRHCNKLSEIQGLENLLSLKVLKIYGCAALRDSPNLPKDVSYTHGKK